MYIEKKRGGMIETAIGSKFDKKEFKTEVILKKYAIMNYKIRKEENRMEITLYRIESFGLNGDYLPFVQAVELNGQVEEINAGDNIHNDGYEDFYYGYKMGLEKLNKGLDIKEIQVDVSNRKILEEYKDIIEKSGCFKEFLDDIERAERDGTTY